MTQQESLFELSKKMVPGGVHSPVRSFKGLHRGPLFFQKGEGAYLTDVDGNSFIDFCMSFGPLILGHADPDVKEDLKNALDNGWSFGACEPYSLKLAEFILSKIPFIEQIRFVNSGTEAVMTALRLARGYTSKTKILKFNGCYHGHVDSMLIKAGSGLAGEAESSSKGVSNAVSNETLILELGDQLGVLKCFETYGHEIAAVIVEPLPANNGLLIQNKAFISFLRDITKKNKSLLIFDEVISGFRVGIGGMAEELSIEPDLVTYGKIIGGGLPVGALAGKREIMEHLAPMGDVYQAGTLSANPLAMVGGLSTLKKCTPDLYKKIEKYTQNIVSIFNHWFINYNNGQFKNFKSISKRGLFWFVSADSIPTSLDKIPSTIKDDFKILFETLLKKGIYLAPNAYEVGFVSLAHDEKCQKDLEIRLYS